MQKFILGCLLYVSVLSEVTASGEPWPVGGRAVGIANTTVALADGWALFNNPAGVSGIKQMHFLFAHDNRFGLEGLQGLAAGLVYPLKFGNAGVGIQKTGDALYNEHIVGFAYGHKLNHVQVGIKTNYTQIHVADLGTKGVITFEFGGIATISPQLSFGAHIYNFTQARLASYQDERIPTVMKTGISYKPITKLMLNLEGEKDINFPATVKAGIEYQVINHVYVRTGISTKPGVNYFGLGISKKKFQLDYALHTHATLGLSHHLSVALTFEKRTNRKPKNT